MKSNSLRSNMHRKLICLYLTDLKKKDRTRGSCSLSNKWYEQCVLKFGLENFIYCSCFPAFIIMDKSRNIQMRQNKGVIL